MSNPNIVLAWWQLTLMAVVPVVTLAGWLIACFIAAREPEVRNVAAAGPAGGTGTAASTQDTSSQGEPARPDRRLAA